MHYTQKFWLFKRKRQPKAAFNVNRFSAQNIHSAPSMLFDKDRLKASVIDKTPILKLNNFRYESSFNIHLLH